MQSPTGASSTPMLEGETPVVRLDTLPDQILGLVVRVLDWRDRYRLAVTCRRLLQAVPSVPFCLPTGGGPLGDALEVFLHNLGLAGWLRLVLGPPDTRLPVPSLTVDLSLSTGQARAAPLSVWQAVHRLLQCLDVLRALRIGGLGLQPGGPAAGPGGFTALGRTICCEVNRLSGLELLHLGMSTQAAAPGEPFELRLDGCFERLRRLEVVNGGGGGDVVLTLGRMPRLQQLAVGNLRAGGWVVPKERLPSLVSVAVGLSCPRFAEPALFEAVHTVVLEVRPAAGGEEGGYGNELAGCAGLAALPRLQTVCLKGGATGRFQLGRALVADLKRFDRRGINQVFLVKRNGATEESEEEHF